jgi:hypothetical protein
MVALNRVTARPTLEKHAADVVPCALSFLELPLPEDAELSSVETPTVETIEGTSTTPLAVSQVAVSAATVTDAQGGDHPAGQAVTFTLAGGTAGCAYKVTFEATTDAGSVHAGCVIVEVKA